MTVTYLLKKGLVTDKQIPAMTALTAWAAGAGGARGVIGPLVGHGGLIADNRGGD